MIVFLSYVYNKSLVLTILQGSRLPAAASFLSPQEQCCARMSRETKGSFYPGSLGFSGNPQALTLEVPLCWPARHRSFDLHPAGWDVFQPVVGRSIGLQCLSWKLNVSAEALKGS